MPATLPSVSRAAVRAIMDLLISRQGMKRRPEKAAELLALVVELHERHRPFPPRAEVAAAIGASVSTVDAALSTRLDEGYITMEVETPHGRVQRRNSVIRERYYVPSNELQEVVAKAKQNEAKRAKLAKLEKAIRLHSRRSELQPVYDQWRREQGKFLGKAMDQRQRLEELAQRLRVVLNGEGRATAG